MSPSERERIAAALDRAWREWRALGVLRHVAVMVGLVVLIRWWPEVSYPEPLRDDRCYVAGFEAARQQRPLYQESCYLYPPVFAEVGGWVSSAIGTLPTVRLLRAANVLGIVVMVLAAAWVPVTLAGRAAVALALVLSSPAVAFGMECANLSLAVAGLMGAALMWWREYPVAAGLSLGIGVGVKPIAPLAAAVLSVHRPQPASRKQWVAGGLGLVLAAVMILAVPGLRDFLLLAERGLEHRTASVHRLVYLLIGPGYSGITSMVVGVIALWWVRRLGPMGRLQAAAIAIAATLSATPLVWGHTHVASVPIQGAVLAVWWLRREHRVPLETVAVMLSLAASHLAQGVTGVYGSSSPWLEAVGVVPTTLAPIVLAGYLVWASEPV